MEAERIQYFSEHVILAPRNVDVLLSTTPFKNISPVKPRTISIPTQHFKMVEYLMTAFHKSI